MDWKKLSEILSEAVVPEDIAQNENRLKDYLKGAKDAYDTLLKIYGDDLK